MLKDNKSLSIRILVIGVVIIFCLIGFRPLATAEDPPAHPALNQPPPAADNQTPASNKGKPAPTTTPEAKNEVVIALNAPELGPYGKEGLDQRRAAEIAVEEINTRGGILGKKIKLVQRDTKSNPRIAKENAVELFDKEEAQMIFGGVSSAVAQVVGKVAKIKEKIFFATSAYSTDLTAEEGHKYIFRECSDSRMAARVLSAYLKKNFSGKNYFYVTVDYNWGWTTEEIFRKITDTTDKYRHRSYLTNLGADDFSNVLGLAREVGTEVLVLNLFGRDLSIALKQAYEMGLKNKMQIVVPNITIEMADGAGPEAMEGILSTTPWYWKLPFDENQEKGRVFVKKYDEKYNRYPSSAGASAYVILYQYKEAVERAKTFDTLPVIKALEDYKYIGLKDEQQWRGFDHQSIQTVFAVKGKKVEEVKRDKYQLDYFEVINKMKGEEAAITKEEWDEVRLAVSAAPALEE
jgi:branched-chain amino acid transport system substrate-binding protein